MLPRPRAEGVPESEDEVCVRGMGMSPGCRVSVMDVLGVRVSDVCCSAGVLVVGFEEVW